MAKNSFIPETPKRVPKQTDMDVNEQIRDDTVHCLNATGSDTFRIRQRLRELDKEWDVERTLEASAASFSLMGLTLGATTNKKWYALPAVVGGFLLQHAVQGWCPPLSVIRRMGVRTQREIDNERSILLARLGVFEDIESASSDEALRKMEYN